MMWERLFWHQAYLIKTQDTSPAKDLLILKYCTLYPSETFITLKNNPNVPFADSLVKVVARKYPAQLYTYAQANNKLGAIIRGIHDDEFVKAVVRMSKSKSGQQYFPFLDNIVKGKMTFEQIDSAEVDSVQYFRLLVKTQLDYTERLLNKDTAIAFKELTAKLEKKAKDVFVTTINGLHDETDAVRFRIIQPLKAEELYYLAVLTDGLIYTSSYTKGVYPLMMKKVNNRGDSLLMLMHFDKYRKFIKMAAGFNMLSNFLSSFPPSATQPKMLILDEATSNVDTRTEKLIQQGLNRLMRGRTSFVIAHRLTTIRDADQILVINAGVIVERGTHDELIAMGGLYHTLYETQFRGQALD